MQKRKSLLADRERIRNCLFPVAALILLPGCELGYQQGNGIFGTSGNSGTLQVIPSSTSVAPGQSVTFQVSGGTPPYQFQTNGGGTIDSNGNYQAGPTPGQGQIEATDSAGNYGSATVSIVQSSFNNMSLSNKVTLQVSPTNSPSVSSSLIQSEGWAPASKKKSPLVRGEVIGTEENQLDSHGDEIESKFLKTDLQHPVVRADELIEANQEVADRAIIEDQFVVKLGPGYSQSDLADVINKAGAHISKQLDGTDTYLVSTGKKGASLKTGQNLTPDFLARRAQFKKALQRIGTVTPNFVAP